MGKKVKCVDVSYKDVKSNCIKVDCGFSYPCFLLVFPDTVTLILVSWE